jgi:tight adherence protein B
MMSAAFASGVLVAAAVVAWGGVPGRVLLHVRGINPLPGGWWPARDRLFGWLSRPPPAALGILFTAGGALAGAVLLRVPGDLLVGVLRGGLLGGALLAGWTTYARRRAASLRAERTQRWQEAGEVMAAQLRAGRSAPQALEAAAVTCPELLPAARQLHLGGNVAHALLEIPSAPAAAGLASAWATAEASGAALAGVVERVLSELQVQQEIRREVESQLAGPRATARLLSVLPVAGVALGFALGVDVPHTLLSTVFGLACLTAGGALALLGLAWVERLVAREST